MRAARLFSKDLELKNLLDQVFRVKLDLYGSLALTGKGHGTDFALMLGLEGYTPEAVNPDEVGVRVAAIRKTEEIDLLKKRAIAFDEGADLVFHKDKQLPYHPNGMRFTAYDAQGKERLSSVYYSVGGGFIIDHVSAHDPEAKLLKSSLAFPYPFKTAKQLLDHCFKLKVTIAQLMMENEKSLRSEQEVKEGVLHIWKAMSACIARGCATGGILPGGLNVRRRAKAIYDHLSAPHDKVDPAAVLEWVSVWALAVNEENAAGGRVVTAPTNGSAGVIPSVLKYYEHFIAGASDEGIITMILTAAAIGILYKEGASISAAEMGCMGEVGVACSMAAAGLAAVLGATNEQIENAAEIGMEHNLGLTCDPIKGLVQIPCIERNTMGAVKAINAAMLALRGDGVHHVSLDQVIATMRATGHDMQSIYKETSLGGLAVNVPEC
jgi:L-serine dehydratase